MKITNISFLGREESSIPSGLSKGIGVASNFTQPFANDQTPRRPSRDSIALAAMFAVNLGSTETNETALLSIARNLIGS